MGTVKNKGNIIFSYEMKLSNENYLQLLCSDEIYGSGILII